MFSAAVSVLAVLHAHPSSLECGDDATTRLSVGSTIMGAPTVAAAAGQTDIVVKSTGNGGITITANTGFYFAAKAFGDGAVLTTSSAIVPFTSNCTNQVYFNGTGAEAPATYTLIANKATSSIAVGYAAMPGAVSLVTLAL